MQGRRAAQGVGLDAGCAVRALTAVPSGAPGRRRAHGRLARFLREAAAAFSAALALVLPATTAAAQGAVLTLLEGDAIVLDGARSLAATAGQRLPPGSIIDTSPRTGLLRVEWPDGTTLDLAAGTRAMLQPPGYPAREGKVPAAYVLQGWAKLAAGTAAAAGVATAGVDVLPGTGSIVVHVAGADTQVFVESGKPVLVERRVKGAPRAALSNGQFFAGGSAERGTVAERPPGDFLKTTPRAFRDAIPRRFAAMKDRKAEPPTLGDANYATLADWLAAEPAIRRDFPRRFAALAQEPAFRAAVLARLPAHPEWAPVVQPRPPGS